MLSSNLSLVNNFFGLEGWRLLLMSLILLSAFFIRGLAFSRSRVSFMTLNMSGFLGLKVDTKVRIGVSSLSLSFDFLRSSIGISVAFCAPNSISWTGYPCLTNVFCNSINLWFLVFFSSTIVQILLARLKGMFLLVCDGCDEIKST